MRLLTLWAILFLLTPALPAFSTDFDVDFYIDGISNDDAVLAYYYLDKKYISDTVRFDSEGHGVFSGEKDITPGVYLLAFPSMDLRYFEFILGEEPVFTMRSDTSDFIANMEVEGSLENLVFYEDLKFMTSKGKQATDLQKIAADAEEGSTGYNAAIEGLNTLNREVVNHRKKIAESHPNLLYAKMMRAMIEVEIPDNPDPSDSSYAYRYYRDHFFDNIDFSDRRLLYTPFFTKKITTYLNDYTIPIPDSINAAADRILDLSMADPDVFQATLITIFNKYARSKIMSHELVYVHLARKYYLSGLADWVTDEQLQTFRERIQKMEPTMLGQTAPQIVIEDIDGQVRRLHDEASAHDFTILLFWNSGCSHCQKMVPKLKEDYEANLKNIADILVFAVSTERETDEWKGFIDEHHLRTDGWIHCHDPLGSHPFRVLYDIESTPLVLILDRNLKIIAKRISEEDIGGLIEFEMNRKANSDQK